MQKFMTEDLMKVLRTIAGHTARNCCPAMLITGSGKSLGSCRIRKRIWTY